MNSHRTAMIIGATGAVGGQLLARLIAHGAWERIVGIGRGKAPLEHPRFEWVQAELAELPAHLAGRQSEDAFCCLGTTMKRAGTRAAFRAVDRDGVLGFAQAARAAGTRFFGLVSAAGAAPRSPSFYLRTKGEAEAAVAALGFPRLAIMQPGLLVGPRPEQRPMERVAALAAPVTDRLLLGSLQRFRSVAIETVADALLAAALHQPPGEYRYTPGEMARIAGAGDGK